MTLETKLFGMGRCVCGGGGAEVMGQVSDGMLKRGSSPDRNISYLIVFGRSLKWSRSEVCAISRFGYRSN